MNLGQTGIDLDGVVDVLCALGSDELGVRDQLALTSGAEAVVEVAALTVESEAGLLLTPSDELDVALFELVDALRQAGMAISLAQTASAPALVLGELPNASVFEVGFAPGADVPALVRAVASLLPDHVAQAQRVLFAPHYDAAGAFAFAVLDDRQHRRLRAAVGGDALDSALVRADAAHPAAAAHPADAKTVSIEPATLERLLTPDFSLRLHARMPDVGGGRGLEAFDAKWSRLQKYDARIAWPEGLRRPPGDDFFELTSLLAAEPLLRALQSTDSAPLATVLYQFALTTTVGALWDVQAARQNPGMSAQGVLGMGQLAWSWFIFAALGAEREAERAGKLLDDPWVRAQERGSLAVRQRAWFDLGVFLRSGKRGVALGRLRELLPLTERAAWQEPASVAAALGLHTEPRGDQLTHNPLYHVWPAPLYALARHAGATALLPADDSFLSRPLDVSAVDRSHALLVWLEQQLARFDGMDQARLPPLLDPLPVVVDVRVTEVDARDAHGRTLLADREDAEHHVVAPHGGRAMKAGEIWLFEVQGARQTRARARHDDLGEVTFHIALPTGEWLSRAAESSHESHPPHPPHPPHATHRER